MLGQATGQPTATARALDQSEADVDLAAIAGDTEDALNNAILWLGFWIGEDAPGAVSVFKDFKAFATPDDLGILLKSVIAGKLTLTTYLAEVQRRGLIDASVNVQDEAELIGIESDREMEAIARSMGDLDDGDSNAE